MLLLWCACNSQHKYVHDYLYADYQYEETELGQWLCRSIFKMQLYSKYDVLMKSNAAAHAYKDMIYKMKYSDPITVVLSAKRDLILHVQKKYKIDNLEVVYELNEDEIFQSGRL